MKRLSLVLAFTLLAAACSNGDRAGSAAMSEAAPAADAAAAPAAAPRQGYSGEPGTTPERPAVSVPLLAYEYRIGLEVPLKQLPRLIEKHEKACIDAGPTVCQVIGSNTTSEGDGAARATLEIRAEPSWLRRYRAQVQADARGSGGKVANAAVETEDLTRAIIDTEAALRAKTTLRDRLQALLASRPGKLQELLEVERELARVQGEIDATQSELAVMRTRIATSKLTVSYTSLGSLAPDNAWRPIDEALHDVLRNIAGGFAFIIQLLSVLLPFAVVFGPLIWLLLRWMKRRKAAKLAAQGGEPSPPPAPKPASPRPRGLRS